MFVDYEQKGQKIELIGIEDTDGQKAHKLRITSQNSIIRYVYLDAKDFLNIKESYKSKSNTLVLYQNLFFRCINKRLIPINNERT